MALVVSGAFETGPRAGFEGVAGVYGDGEGVGEAAADGDLIFREGAGGVGWQAGATEGQSVREGGVGGEVELERGVVAGFE